VIPGRFKAAANIVLGILFLAEGFSLIVDDGFWKHHFLNGVVRTAFFLFWNSPRFQAQMG